MEAVRPYTMIENDRLEKLFRLAKLVFKKQIPGDIVECGVCNGGSAALIAAAIQPSDRKIWLYDTFSGIPAPGKLDGPAASAFTGGLKGDLVKVREVFSAVSIPEKNIVIREGEFNKTFAQPLPGTIALLHIDADWYESVGLCLETFYTRVSEGGVIILDDFGYWEGTRLAFYEFCRKNRIAPLLERVGDTQAYWIKGREHNRHGRDE